MGTTVTMAMHTSPVTKLLMLACETDQYLSELVPLLLLLLLLPG